MGGMWFTMFFHEPEWWSKEQLHAPFRSLNWKAMKFMEARQGLHLAHLKHFKGTSGNPLTQRLWTFPQTTAKPQ